MWSAQTEDPNAVAGTDLQRLVRLCATLSGQRDAAEDLAQETLLEAWRHQKKLQDPDAYWQWLAAIARNINLRWCRQRGRRITRELQPAPSIHPRDEREPAASEAGIEIELERRELALFLDRAMALLPPETRAVLIHKYIEDQPQSDIAARLRLSEGAVEARLHRGKLMLRKLLSTELREEAESLGLVVRDADTHKTRIWCPLCGKHYLLATIDHTSGVYNYRCSGQCIPTGAITDSSEDRRARPTQNLSSPKVILTRLLLALHKHYQQVALDGGQPCARCGRPLPLETLSEEESGFAPGILMRCPTCGFGDSASLWHLALDTPAAQQFWKEHPRMRALSNSSIEHEDVPSVIGGFESLYSSARLLVLFHAGSYRVLETWRER